MSESTQEMAFLESVIPTYVTSGSAQDRVIKTLAWRNFRPYMRAGGRALEFGCCDGFMTELIADHVDHLTSVDGSSTFIEMAKMRGAGNVDFVHSLFEDFKPEVEFDYIFATWVLEHVSDAIGFLTAASRLLAKGGLLFIAVPNARAFSRQLARHMGVLDDLFALTSNDTNHGHRRVYDRLALNQNIERSGLCQVAQGGLLFKLLADFQLDQMIDAGILGDSQIEGLHKIGLEYPDFCGSLFSICRRLG